MTEVGLDGLVMRLLVLAVMDEKTLKGSLRKHPAAPEGLLQVAADERLHRSHARVVFSVAAQSLLELAAVQDRADLRPILNHYGYLAGTLHRLYPEDPEFQVSWLRQLLHLGHGKELDMPAVRYVLESTSAVPTDELLAAILPMVDQGNIGFVENEYIRCRVMRTRFSSQTHGELLRLLPEYIHGIRSRR